MKKQGFVIWLQGFLLAFIIGFSGIATFVSGLSLPVSLWQVALWCALSACICSFCCGRRLGLVVLGLFVLAIGILLYTGLLVKSACALLYFLSAAYQQAFGWNVVHLGGFDQETMVQALPAILCLWGSVVCAVTAWSVVKGQSAVPAVLIALPAPILCLLVAASNPGMLWLWLLIFGVVLLMVTASTRFDDEKRGSRLTWFTAAPVALAVVVLFAAVPKNAYTGQARAQAWSDAILSDGVLRKAWDSFTGKEDPTHGVMIRKVSLENIGQRQLSDDSVASVTSSYSGTIYLRSSAFDTYDGITWTDSGDGTTLSWPDESMLGKTGEVVISTRYAHAMLYTPYYVTSLDLDRVSRGVENTKKLNYYSITCAPMPEQSYFSSLYPDPYDNPHVVDSTTATQCTALPESTLRWAKPLAEEITKDKANSYHKALAIADYVRNSATYSLDPKVMPAAQQDFARWFLQQSDSGYCVHFATATTVLLKAAGIPARYVSGYKVTADAGIITPAKESDAHAWTEYWLPGFGWTVLESTPAAPPPTVTDQGTPEEKQPMDFSVPQRVWIGIIIAVPVSVIAQWRIRVAAKKRRFKRGDARQQVICRYGYLAQLHELLKEEIDAPVTMLAEKAKFSQHEITADDVAVMDSAIDAAKGKLRKCNLFKRIYHTLFLAQL